jgi:hypothetical protein
MSIAMPAMLAVLAAAALAAPAPAATSLNPATWRGDPQFLVAAVDSLHPKPYRIYRRAAWDSAAADLDRRLPTLRYDQAVAGFSRLIGMLGEGHSRLDQVQLASHNRPALAPLPGPGFSASYPIEFDVFADGLRVVRATAAHASLLGAHVSAIDGRPVAEAVAALVPLIPADNDMWRFWILPVYLRSPGYLSAAGLANDPAAPLRLTFTDSSGKRGEASIAAEKPDSTARWIAADSGVRTPLPLSRALPGPFAFADLEDSVNTVFIRLREIANAPGGETLAQFVARAFAHMDSIRCRCLILDVRGNGGGNNYLNQPLVHAVIRHPDIDRPGGLFVIVDRGTFSAAVSLACDLERETHAVFVGEPTGAAPNSPGDPAHVTLPASGLVVRISTVLWNGSDPRDPRAFIAPDLPAMPIWADWIAHRDPALAAIAAWRPDPKAADVPPNTNWGYKANLEPRLPNIAW